LIWFHSALQKNLHVLKVERHCVGLQEIVTDHASQVKAKSGIFGYKKAKAALLRTGAAVDLGKVIATSCFIIHPSHFL